MTTTGINMISVEGSIFSASSFSPPFPPVPGFFVYSWVPAEIMVVSEIGARLSPKIAPPTIAPASTGALLPNRIPAG